MSLADSLRKEMGVGMLPDWFAEDVVRKIKSFGRASYICARHINGVTRSAFPLKYENALYEWARQNGFNTEDYYNSYGVRYIRITL